ncbi:hypothetical protein JTE90_000505 [Oedothorax gibbosus]|uniref:Uncharacterized protein n=1 Tax=Oedothorax gibbosus TaxID=931172 RepID=A0AAV6VV75_9ARAC|nr:hypothetical protein JTE90_000505 [Oedothorax gibbosus]
MSKTNPTPPYLVHGPRTAARVGGREGCRRCSEWPVERPAPRATYRYLRRRPTRLMQQRESGRHDRWWGKKKSRVCC